MYRDKIGIISDAAGDNVVFSGSANESTHALLPTFNYESINVFPGWRPELDDYSAPHIESFDRLWRNESPATAVIDIPTAVKERLISVARNLGYFWIGDECHHHTSHAYDKFLPEHARYRIGLSATPKHYLDEERNERLAEFYGGVVSHYALRQAIEDDVLTPYLYYPHRVTLTEAEAEEFVSLSEQIGRILARQKNVSAIGINAQLTALLMRRARIVGSAANKLPELDRVLDGVTASPHTLFYILLRRWDGRNG